MNFIKKHIGKIIEWGVVALILVFCWYFFLKPLGSSQSEIYKQVSKYNDEKIKSIQGERDGYKLALDKTDTLISLIREQFSMLQNQVNQSQQIYKRLDAKINDIPFRIAAIADNDDSIKAAFSNYPDR